jgi:hypothetical protein
MFKIKKMWNDHPTKPFLPSMIYVQKAIPYKRGGPSTQRPSSLSRAFEQTPVRKKIKFYNIDTRRVTSWKLSRSPLRLSPMRSPGEQRVSSTERMRSVFLTSIVCWPIMALLSTRWCYQSKV